MGSNDVASRIYVFFEKNCHKMPYIAILIENTTSMPLELLRGCSSNCIEDVFSTTSRMCLQLLRGSVGTSVTYRKYVVFGS